MGVERSATWMGRAKRPTGEPRARPSLHAPAVLVGVLSALAVLTAPAALAAGAPPFEPIAIQRLDLPAQIKEASTPVFTRDGHHLLFFSGGHLWIVADDGSGLNCLSCGVSGEPAITQLSEQEGLATPFPDGKRVFFGPYGDPVVLECSPSVLACESRQILPLDLSAARPDGGLVLPGGADLLPGIDLGGASSPKLAPDGIHIAFSDVRSDAAELMVLATLKRSPTGYVASDPRVLNPAGPSSIADPNTLAWSESSALYEFKSFADGGADVTYVEAGGPATLNPDVWELDLSTGRRTRLTAGPDWDEDDAPSPDGSSLLVESDRTMHRSDMLGGLLPVRGFIDAPQVAIYASYFVADAAHRQCDLQPWLLPASGDGNATLLGEPIQPYSGGNVHAANNVSGYPQWSPDGTEIALNTEDYTTNLSAPYLLIAHLSARRATQPLAIVSSAPGSWAPSPQSYHGAIQANATVLLRGLAAGYAIVSYSGFGVVSGNDSATYFNYSDNGRDFVNGTTRVSDLFTDTGPIAIHTNLTMSGADSGYSRINLLFNGADSSPVTASGTALTSYDGTTISGPPQTPAPCPQSLPRAPQLTLTATLDGAQIHAHVSASIAGAGANEALSDTRPVLDATVSVGETNVLTDNNGDAVLSVAPHTAGPVSVSARAGDTFAPAQTTVPGA